VGDTPRPEQTRKYEEHLDGNVKEKINTSHLISWSLQIARGMAFLASKKVTPLYYYKYYLFEFFGSQF
jgi:hypothetical protein